MREWIFNASPLILLGKIQQLHLIECLSPGFRIPRAVVEEIGAGPIDDPTVVWLECEGVAHHIVGTPPAPTFLEQWNLGAGETAVLSLALAEEEAPVVLDDLAARNFAVTFGLPLLGTIGLLLRAKQRNLIGHLEPELRHLEAVGANLSSSVIAHALKLAGECVNTDA